MFDAWIFTTPAPEPDARIAYGRGPHRFAELRLPKVETEGQRVPTVVVIHGGYWLAEIGVDHVGHACADLAARGYATWAIEYRRLGNIGGGWPGMFRDVGKAVDHLRGLADEHRLDLDNLRVLGHSAGGQLGLWLAARRQLSEASSIYAADPLPVARVVALAPLSDLHMASELGLCAKVIEQVLAGSPEHRPQRYADTSPAARLPLGVEQRVLHGAADRLVPVAMSQAYAERAQAAGDDVSLEVLAEAGHFELVDPRAAQWARVVAALA